jgi:Spy/CpxP family protein refolding chaperone
MRLVMVTLAAICISGTAAAEQATPGDANSGSRWEPTAVPAGSQSFVDHLTGLLDLNEGQKARLQAVLAEQQAKLDEYLREQKVSGQNPTQEQMLAMLARLHEESMDQLRSILTGAQLAKFEQHRRPVGPSAHGS